MLGLFLRKIMSPVHYPLHASYSAFFSECLLAICSLVLLLYLTNKKFFEEMLFVTTRRFKVPQIERKIIISVLEGAH